MLYQIKLVSMMSLGLLMFNLHAFGGEIEIAEEQLNQVIRIVSSLERDAERLDEASLLLLRKRSERALESMKSVGLGNVQTLEHYSDINESFSNSISLFRFIETDANRNEIKRLFEVWEQIAKARGFHGPNYSKNVHRKFSQMHELFTRLKKSVILTKNLQDRINDLVAPLADVIATSKAGDLPDAYDAGDEMYVRVQALYSEISEIERSNVAYEILLEIQGLNEEYAAVTKLGHRRSDRAQ